MGRLLIGLAAALWCSLVFIISLYVTFPSDALIQRAAWQVQDATDGEMQLTADTMMPWWTGVSATGLQLNSVTKGRNGEPDISEPMAKFSSLQVRARTVSLLGSTPSFVSYIGLGGGTLEVDATFGRAALQEQKFIPADLNFSGDKLPIMELARLANITLEGNGSLTVNGRLSAPEGMQKSNGKITLRGKNLAIARMALDGIPELTDLVIDELELVLDIENGRAEIMKGTLVSNLAEFELEGDIRLQDLVRRSRLNLTAKFTVGDQLAMVKGMLKSALGDDEKYHYRITGMISRPSYRPGGKTSRSRPSRSSSASSKEKLPRSPLSAEDRKKRTEEIQERVRQRREARKSGDSTARRPMAGRLSRDDDEEDFEDGDTEDFEDAEPEPEEPGLEDPTVDF